jgi:hypothetical protein
MKHRKYEINELVKSLGGETAWSFHDNFTHYIHHGNREEENFKEFKNARSKNATIVSPWWLYKVFWYVSCNPEQGNRV